MSDPVFIPLPNPPAAPPPAPPAPLLRWARVVDGVVTHCVEAAEPPGDDWVDGTGVGPGWRMGGDEPLPPAEDLRIWWIDVGPFKDRLGMDAPAIAASSHSACRGVIAMLEGRKYVDLKDPRTGGMLDVLIATVQPTADAVWPTSGPMTPEKKSAILNTPTTEGERHIKGLS